MDNDTLKLIARLKIGAARLQLPVDVVRFVADKEYAQQALIRFADMADEEGVLLVLQLVDKLGLGAATAPPALHQPPELLTLPQLRHSTSRRRDASAAPALPAPKEADPRYVGRLR